MALVLTLTAGLFAIAPHAAASGSPARATPTNLAAARVEIFSLAPA